MALADYSLLVIPALLVVGALLTAVSSRASAATARLSIAVFDRFESPSNRRIRRRQALRSAHTPTTYDRYAAVTATKAVLGGIAGGVVGIYVLWGALEVLSVSRETAEGYLPEGLSFLAGFVGVVPPTGVDLFVYQAGAALAFGVGTALAVYYYRWYHPRYVAEERERRIDMSLPMTVSFFYALSRSGMSFPDVMRVLADNDHVYGTAADEVEIAVRNIELFGMDVVTAVKTMARRSPSDRFREFSENLASVLQTGGSLSDFLHREYQEFREEAEAQQERLLELIATLAEAYVTLGVVGPLFFIVVLTVAGIAVSDSLPIMQVIVYAAMPLGNLAFMIYLSTVVESLSGRETTREKREVSIRPRGIRRAADVARERADRAASGGRSRLSDGGAAASERVRRNIDRLAVYKQLREVRQRLASPVRTVVHRPTALLWVTFPLAVFLIGIRIPGLIADDGVLTIVEFDDLVIQSLILLLGTFAIAYEAHRRRVEAIESSIPDFLERMASLNEAGMTVVDSFDRIRDSELGRLNDEIEILWRDMQWGADVETALKRFEDRIRTQTVSRMVTLMTEAMKASGSLGTVLRIAAGQAKSDRRLKQKRRQEMLTYIVVVYVAFFVFLFIVGVVNALLTNLPDTSAIAGFANNSTVGGGQSPSIPGVSRIGDIDQAAYRLTFLHATMVQAVCSGLVAGQLSTGDLRAGAKHATVMLILGYAAFVFVLGV